MSFSTSWPITASALRRVTESQRVPHYRTVEGPVLAVPGDSMTQHRRPVLLLTRTLLHCLTPLRQTFLLLLTWGSDDGTHKEEDGWKMEAMLEGARGQSSVHFWASLSTFSWSLFLKPVSLRMSSRKSSFTSNSLPFTEGHKRRWKKRHLLWIKPWSVFQTHIALSSKGLKLSVWDDNKQPWGRSRHETT